MRKCVNLLLGAVVPLLCWLGCTDNPKSVANTDELTLVYTEKSENSLYEWMWIYTTPEGHLVIDTLGRAPQNQEVIMRDSCYRLVCMAGQASEVGRMNFVKVVYLKADTVDYFVSGSLEVLEDSLARLDSLNEQSGRYLDPQLVMLTRIVTKWKSYDRPYWQRFCLQRDDDGCVVAVSDPVTKKSITAPAGNKIRYELKEDENFWASDINGGLVKLYFYVEPKDESLKNYHAKVYDGYMLMATRTYEKGNLVNEVMADDYRTIYEFNY